ncbi:hypothetical protein C8N24_0684 [Solirubrobacter pauli]|uniref:Uncharacterized protein n=1 Tax=Solirubrobacter pauli TaxID=166793 RepID=A0A660L8M4_9ACTN|nr:hypothetical protein [Solirubrobacter pauli]RKQ90869.1 hypothetical protein C8N24_0684 [Solirubrobacter pauli]
MLGWHLSVYRLGGVERAPAGDVRAGRRLTRVLNDAADAEDGRTRIAVWQVGAHGLDWLDALVKQREAVSLGGNGYPTRYAGPARSVLPVLTDDPPAARRAWASDSGDILLPQWDGKTTVDREAAAACHPDEWLLVEAWDES